MQLYVEKFLQSHFNNLYTVLVYRKVNENQEISVVQCMYKILSMRLTNHRSYQI